MARDILVSQQHRNCQTVKNEHLDPLSHRATAINLN